MQAHALARDTRALARAFAAALVLAACVAACKLDDAMPPTPAAAATDAETREAARLRAHVLAIPGVVDASVVVSITPIDPFARTSTATAAAATALPPPARVAFVVATRAGADTGVIGDAAQTAAHAALGANADVQVQIAPAPAAPRLVAVGPFRVTAGSRNALLVTLALALLAVGGLSTALAVSLVRAYRRGMRPHQSSTSTTRGS
ncbi:MAG TPA: hypothetical protein VM261_09980 [Kofleriaceae bacterium]|nr:hypothetical protein [Kofleriaceae bacterium]